MRWTLWIGVALGCAACSSGDSNGDGGRKPPSDSTGVPCVDQDSECGATCSASEPCSTGLYCVSGKCAKSCVAGELDGPLACEGTAMCNVNGQCVTVAPIGGSPAPTPIDGGSPRDGSMTKCNDTVVQASRVEPTVILIVDQSSSMEESFGADTRWNVLRDFLLQEPDGLIAELQSQVRFGLAMYSARSMEAPDPMDPNMTIGVPDGECPLVTTVPPMLDNFQAIADSYRANEPIDDTPTGDSIEKVIEDLGLTFDPDAKAHPTVFVLATDGEPDRCEQLDPQPDVARDEAIAAVEHAFSLGIRTFVISVGNEVGEDHQQDIANAGLGRMMGEEDAEYWEAGDDRSLRDALSEIIGAQVSCEVALEGMVKDGDACLGRVTLNGNELTCDDPNGWELSDSEHIRLLGDACEELKMTEEVLLEVSFPCEVSVVL